MTWTASDERSDVRCMLLRAFAKTLVNIATQSESDATWVAAHLETLPTGLKTRLRYYVASRSAPYLREEVSALLADPKLLAWELPGREGWGTALVAGLTMREQTCGTEGLFAAPRARP